MIKVIEEPAICETKSGRFKLYIQGQADDHVMDWAGCNFKFVSVTRQPRAGFETLEEAAIHREKIKRFWKEEAKRAQQMTGSWIPDRRYHLLTWKRLQEILGKDKS